MTTVNIMLSLCDTRTTLLAVPVTWSGQPSFKMTRNMDMISKDKRKNYIIRYCTIDIQ